MSQKESSVSTDENFLVLVLQVYFKSLDLNKEYTHIHTHKYIYLCVVLCSVKYSFMPLLCATYRFTRVGMQSTRPAPSTACHILFYVRFYNATNVTASLVVDGTESNLVPLIYWIPLIQIVITCLVPAVNSMFGYSSR